VRKRRRSFKIDAITGSAGFEAPFSLETILTFEK